MTAPPATDLERLAIDTIRTLSMDAVQQANSGHPGLPMAHGARSRTCSTREVMSHNPSDPAWPDRDRFVLSAGHGSMLLYAALHLSGYDLPLDEHQAASASGARSRPGHPERDRVHVTPGVEVTTGPLGQGFANGVGMAMAERFLRERYGAEVQDHRIVRDLLRRRPDGGHRVGGGVARRPARARAHRLPLRRQLDLARRPDVAELRQRGRHRALRGLRLARADGRRRQRPRRAAGRDQGGPGGGGAPVAHPRARRSSAGPPRTSRARARRTARRWARTRSAPRRRRSAGIPDAHFVVPDGVYEAFSASRARRRGARGVDGALRALARRRRATGPPSGTPRGAASRCPASRTSLPTSTGTRTSSPRASAGQQVDGRLRPTRPDDGRRRRRPERVDEDRVPRTRTRASPASTPGRNVFFGVREHGMGGTVNGLAAHGGIVRPYGSTFLQFADYMRGSDAPLGAHGPAGRVGLHARLGRAGRGRPDAPAGRAPRGAARDPGPRRAAPGGRDGDRRGLARHPRGPRGPGRARPVAAGPAGARPRRAGARRGRRAAAPTCCATTDDPEAVIVATGSEVWRRAGGRRPAGGRCPGARRLDAELGAVRGAGRGLPRRRAARGRADGVGRGRDLDGLGALGRRARLDRALRRLRAGLRGPREVRHHAVARRAGRGARPARADAADRRPSGRAAPDPREPRP